MQHVTFYSIIVISFTLFFAGCTTSANKDTPIVSPPAYFSQSGNSPITERWWQTFDDVQLDSFIEEALESNLTLRTAWARLSAARAVLDRESADLWPEADAFVTGRHTRNDNAESNQIELGLMSDYEIDLWGRIRADVDADRFEAQATMADYQTVTLTLSAEITRTWFQLIETHLQRELILEQIRTNTQILELLRARFGTGQIRKADMLRQEQLIESNREQQYALESQLQVLEHQLSVLSGRSPQEPFVWAAATLPTLPALPSTGLPAELVQRRPDVQSAFYRLQAADREVAAAISDRFPRLTLSFTVSTEDDDAVNLFDDWARSFAGNLVGPLLDAGRRQAEVERTRSVKQQRLYDYGQHILTAFKEVEDALVQEQKQQQQLDSLVKQLALAQQTNERLQYDYFNGAGDYIDVLNALISEQRLRRNVLTARRDLLEFRIALYRALAGGFRTEREGDHE